MATPYKGTGFDPEAKSVPHGKNHLLVIAIDEYAHCPKLNNCVKDASEFIEVLTGRYQFEPGHITTLYNSEATRANILSRLNELKHKVRSEDNLVIYFSGHGETEDDVGYWVPVAATPEHNWEFISTYDIKSRLDPIPSFHTFVIVDACFSGALFSTFKSVTSGSEAKRSRWGLAASHSRERALDGTPGENSPFATTLLHQLKGSQDNLSIQELAAAIIRRVERATEGRQTPVFKPLNVKGDDEGQYVFHLKANEAADWKTCQEAGTVAAYRAFLAKYPEGMYAQAAKATLLELEEEAAWEEAKAAHTILSYYQYNQRFPSGKYRAKALEAIERLEEEQAWQEARSAGSLSSFLKYKERYPQGRFAAEAEEQIQAILARQQEPAAWRAAKGKNSLAGYEAYLKEYPQGAYALEARAAIQELKQAAERKTEAPPSLKLRRAEEEERRREQKAAEERRRQEAQRQAAAQAGPVEEVPTHQSERRPEPAFDWKKWGRVGAGILVVVLVIWSISQWGGRGVTPSIQTGAVSFGERTYKTITVNGKTWLAKNLDIEIPGKSWYYEGLQPSEREKYGRLYTWQAAQDACEKLGARWRLPTDTEWKELAQTFGGYYDLALDKYVGDPKQSYKALLGSGNSGFAALLGGYRSPNGSFDYLEGHGFYWSGTQKDRQDAWYYNFGSGYDKLHRYDYDKSFGLSCRCIQGAPSNGID